MGLIADRALSAREFVDECIAFKREQSPRSNFLMSLIQGKATEEQIRADLIGYCTDLVERGLIELEGSAGG